MNRNDFINVLNNKARFYSVYLWNKEFDGEVVINNRLRSTHAWFYESCNRIEFNKKLLNISNEYFVDEVLIHELCHWYCYKMGVDNDDGSLEFETEIYKSGSRSTETVDVKDNGEVWLCDEESWFYCEKCSNDKKQLKIKRSERVNHYGKYIEKSKPKCPVCDNRLTYYCESNHDDRWVKYYPRQKLVDVHRKYLESRIKSINNIGGVINGNNKRKFSY